MERLKLSIIMPVYNAEQYLEKALKSLKNNITDEMEAIIVNDASTDSSAEIIKEFVKKNPKKKFKYIENSENQGAGLTKNVGIDNAKGKYIGFLDADDYIDKNYYSEMLSLAEKCKADMVVSDITLDYGTHQKCETIYFENLYKKQDKGDCEISKKTLLGYWASASACSKIIKRKTLGDLRFSKSNSDDLMFSIPAIIKANKIVYCRNKKYYYFQTPNSVSRNDNIEKKYGDLKCLFKTAAYLLKETDVETTQVFVANNLAPYLCVTTQALHRKNVKKFVLRLKENIEKYSFDTEKLIADNSFIKRSSLFLADPYIEILYLIAYNNYERLIKIYSRPTIIKKIRTIAKLIKHNPDKLIYTCKKKLKKIPTFNPLVSIVIPVYNGENYLKEAIDSALAQTYKNIEIIVVNDGSTDNTEQIAFSYGNKIRYFKQKNGGVSSALNKAIKHMKGEYFSWLSHDDMYYPCKVALQVEYLSYLKNKDVVLFADYRLIDKEGYSKDLPCKINHSLTKKQEYCLLRGCVNGITMLIPKKAFDEVGFFDINLRCTQDYDMWHKMMKKYKFVHMAEVISMTREHNKQATNTDPNVVTEGDALWIQLINDVSDKRKKQLEGTLYNFYAKMLEHLKYSPYEKAKLYCKEQCEKYKK